MADSFHSFVDYSSGFEKKNEENCKMSPETSRMINDASLHGENKLIDMANCRFTVPFCSDFVGMLVVTNVRITIVPQNGFQRSVWKPRRSRILLDDDLDIPIVAIHDIYYVAAKVNESQSGQKRFIPLRQMVSFLEIISDIKLLLKDMRVLTIEISETNRGGNLLNHLFLFSVPVSVENCVQTGARYEWEGNVPFNDIDSWKREIQRCGADKSVWRICDLPNCRVPSYPPHVVVPIGVSDHEVSKLAGSWKYGRFPIWVWSYGSSSLFRASAPAETEVAAVLTKNYFNCLHLTAVEQGPRHAPAGEYTELIIESKYTSAKIATYFDRLHRLCAIENNEQYKQEEKRWKSRLQESGWQTMVTYCLRMTAATVRTMLDQQKSVVLLEESGVDLSAIISSLVQVCCDGYFRTIKGFEDVIDKEWIGLGHPFRRRLMGVPVTEKSEDQSDRPLTAPTFLLFLDCLSQLHRLYPTQFEYSEHLLIAMWDLSLTGFVPAFLCNSTLEQKNCNKKGGPFPLSRFFTPDYTKLFTNVVNAVAHELPVANKNMLQKHVLPLQTDIIRPPISALDVEFWSACYMRSVLPFHVPNGGSNARDEALYGVMVPLAQKLGFFWNHRNITDDNQKSSAYPYAGASDPLTETVGPLSEITLDDADRDSVTGLSVSGSFSEQKRHRSMTNLFGIIRRPSLLSAKEVSSSRSRSSTYDISLPHVPEKPTPPPKPPHLLSPNNREL